MKKLISIFLSIFLVSSTAFAGDLTSVVGMWKMDESSNTNRSDSSGNGNTLTDTNTNVAATTGQFSNAANFDSGTDELARANGSWTGDIDHTSGDYSRGAWVNFTNAGSNIRAMCGKRSGAGAGWETGIAATNKITTYHGTTAITDTGTALSTSTNTHMALSFDDAANTMDFYKDGSSNSQVTSVSSNPTSQTVAFLVNQDASNQAWTGWVDELYEFDRKMTAAEHLDLKTNGIDAYLVQGAGNLGPIRIASLGFSAFGKYIVDEAWYKYRWLKAANKHRWKYQQKRPAVMTASSIVFGWYKEFPNRPYWGSEPQNYFERVESNLLNNYRTAA